MKKKNGNLVIITTGKEDRGGRATIGFCLAASSLSMGINTTVFLTLQGTIWGMQGADNDIKIDGFESLKSYMDQFLEHKGRLLVCSPCVKFFCGIKESKNTKLIKGAEYAGFTTIASLMESCAVATF